MEKEFFYVKPGDNLPPSSSEDLIYSISIDDINSLALFATTLEPEQTVTAVTGYTNALYTYFKENGDNNIYSDCYNKINSNSYGSQFLSTTISLFLLEKRMRINGIDKNILKQYNEVVNAYHNQIEFNKTFNNIDVQKNRKM